MRVLTLRRSRSLFVHVGTKHCVHSTHTIYSCCNDCVSMYDVETVFDG